MMPSRKATAAACALSSTPSFSTNHLNMRPGRPFGDIERVADLADRRAIRQHRENFRFA
jgi:hypothetical protein